MYSLPVNALNSPPIESIWSAICWALRVADPLIPQPPLPWPMEPRSTVQVRLEVADGLLRAAHEEPVEAAPLVELERHGSGAPEVEALLRLHRAGLRVQEVPVEMRERATQRGGDLLGRPERHRRELRRHDGSA